MSNDEADKIRQLEAELEAARQKAKIEAMEAELAALKAKDAQAADDAAAQAVAEAKAAEEAAARAAAEEAARIRAAEEAAAAKEATESAAAADKAAALEAELAALRGRQAEADRIAQEKAAADRAAALEAEVAALRAKEAEQARAAAAAAAAATAAASVPAAAAAPAAPAPVVAPAAPAAATPEIRYVETAPPKKKGGLIAALVVMLVALAGTLGATYFAVRGDLRGPWAAPAPIPTDLVLIAAGTLGPAPAFTPGADQEGWDTTFPELSQPATAATPEPAASTTTLPVAGDTPEIYGLSYVGCYGIDPTKEESAGTIAAWVAAQNADPSLGIGVALTPADFVGYYQHLTFGHLLADTRVTYNGYSAGASFPMQAVLQKGTMVGYDRFGVPRAHCGSDVALTAPVPAEGETRFSGSAWGDLDLAKVVTITPAATPQDSFTVLPVGPSNVQTAFAVGPTKCAWASPCPAPSSLAVLTAPEKTASPVMPTTTECSNYAPNARDLAVFAGTRVVNASGAPVEWFVVDSVADGCAVWHQNTLPSGRNWNTGYWPGILAIMTDQQGTVIDTYVFGEKTLFVIQ